MHHRIVISPSDHNFSLYDTNSRERDEALLGTRFRIEKEKGETGTIYIEPSRERNVGSLA